MPSLKDNIIQSYVDYFKIIFYYLHTKAIEASTRYAELTNCKAVTEQYVRFRVSNKR